MDNFKVAIVNYICPICGRVAEENIICNTLLTPKASSEVEKLQGKNVGYSNHACEELMKKSLLMRMYIEQDTLLG